MKKKGSKHMIDLSVSIKDFIILARKVKEYRKIFPLLFFSAPCQVDVLLIEKHGATILLIRHHSKSPDLEFSVHSAETVNDAISLVDKKFLTGTFWTKEKSEIDAAFLLGNLLSRRNLEMLKTVKVKFLGGRVGEISKDEQILDGIILTKTDVWKIAPRKLLLEAKKHHKTRREAIKGSYLDARAQKKYLFFFGALWYPPIVFKEGKITLRQKMVIDLPYKSHRIMFDNKSQIWILVPLKPPIAPFAKKATECINEIVATANLYGVDGTSITPEDITTTVCDKNLEVVGLGTAPVHARATLRSVIFEDFFQKPYDIYKLNRACGFRVIPSAFMTETVEKAEKITQNEEMKSYLMMYLDAKTNLLSAQHKASFLMGWIILEKYINEIWSETLTDHGIVGKRLHKLTRSILWSTDDKLECLSLFGTINTARYAELGRLKKIRNAVVHEERKVAESDAIDCLELCENVLKETFRSRCFVD